MEQQSGDLVEGVRGGLGDVDALVALGDHVCLESLEERAFGERSLKPVPRWRDLEPLLGARDACRALARQAGAHPVLLQCVERCAGQVRHDGEAAARVGMALRALGWLGLERRAKALLAEAGAVPLLTGLLCDSGAPDGVVGWAIWCMGCFSWGCPAVQQALCEAGAVAGLVACLRRRRTSPRIRCRAVWALTTLCFEYDAAMACLRRQGGIEALVDGLGHPQPPSVRYRCAWCLTNATSLGDSNDDVIREAGGIEALVACLSDHCTPALQRYAAFSLSNLMSASAANRERLTSVGGVAALVRRIDASAPERVREQAVCALRNASVGRLSCAAVRDAGGVKGLERCLHSSSHTIRVQAAWALCNLSRLFDVCRSLWDDGVVGSMVGMLCGASDDVKVAILTTLHHMTDYNSEVVLRVDGLGALLDCTRCASDDVLLRAVRLLHNVAGTGVNRSAIRRAGGDAVLTSCLSSTHEVVLRAVRVALRRLGGDGAHE